MSSPARKDTLRRLVLASRGRIDPQERVDQGAACVQRLLGLDEISAAERVLAYVSVGSELRTGTLLEALLSRGSTLLLPYVADDGMLRASEIRSTAGLAPGYRGIPEPRARMPVDPARADVVVVPGVAFDARGGRLGFGGGFYDRFLQACGDATRIGICFECQVVDEVPLEDHDQRMDIVVTPDRVIRVDP